MKYILYAILVILVLMSLAAGGAKVVQSPQEIQFFTDAGLGGGLIIPLGTLQITGALAAIYHKSRGIALVVVAAGFAISSVVIFLTGNIPFGLVSLIPVLLALFIRSRLPL